MKSVITNKIVTKLSVKYNLSIDTIYNIVQYPFLFLADVIRKGTFESVRLMYLGIFYVKPNRLKYYKYDKRVSKKDIKEKEEKK